MPWSVHPGARQRGATVPWSVRHVAPSARRAAPLGRGRALALVLVADTNLRVASVPGVSTHPHREQHWLWLPGRRGSRSNCVVEHLTNANRRSGWLGGGRRDDAW